MTTRHRDLTTPALYSQTRPSRGTAQASQSAALAELANDAASGHPAQRATVLRTVGGTYHCYIWPDTTAIYYAVRVTASWKTAPVLNAATVTLAVTDGTTTVGPGASPYLPRDLLPPVWHGVSGARLDDFTTREVYVQRDSLVAAGLSPSVPWRFTFVVTTTGSVYVEAIEIAEVSRFATDTADTYGANPDYYQPRRIIDDEVVAIGKTLEAAYDLQRRTYQAVSLDQVAGHDHVTSGTYAPIPGSQLESTGVATRWEVRPRLMGGVPEVQFGVRYRTTGAHTGGVQITTGAGTYTLALPASGGGYVDLFTGVGYLAQATTDEIHWDAFSSAGTLSIASYWIVETP
jgi:hypothetical protein